MLYKFSEKFDTSLLNESRIVGFSIFPDSELEVEDQELKLLLKGLREYYRSNNMKWDSPMSLHPNKPRMVKIRRHLRNDKFIKAMKLKGFDLEKGTRNKYGKLIIGYGEGSRGGRGANSRGLKFEDSLTEDIRLWKVEGMSSNLKYPNIVKALVGQFQMDKANEIEVILAGTENTKRSLIFKPNPEIESVNSGEKLSDLTLRIDGKEYYLSLKFVKTKVSLFNIGIGKILKKSELKKGNISSNEGKKLLDMLEIDQDLFPRVFNEFKKTNFKKYHKEVEPTKELGNFIKSSFGKNYWVVYYKGSDFDFYEVDQKFLSRNSKITTKLKVQYGGIRGNSKYVSVKFDTKDFNFDIHLRNSLGGLYPHLLYGSYNKKK